MRGREGQREIEKVGVNAQKQTGIEDDKKEKRKECGMYEEYWGEQNEEKREGGGKVEVVLPLRFRR